MTKKTSPKMRLRGTRLPRRTKYTTEHDRGATGRRLRRVGGHHRRHLAPLVALPRTLRLGNGRIMAVLLLRHPGRPGQRGRPSRQALAPRVHRLRCARLRRAALATRWRRPCAHRGGHRARRRLRIAKRDHPDHRRRGAPAPLSLDEGHRSPSSTKSTRPSPPPPGSGTDHHPWGASPVASRQRNLQVLDKKRRLRGMGSG